MANGSAEKAQETPATPSNPIRSARSRPTATLLEMVTRFYEGIFTGSAEEQVQTILTEAANVFEADIATWFLVTEDRKQLRLIDVYNDLRRADIPHLQPYELNWDARDETEVRGLTAWTAVSGQPLHVSSTRALTRTHGTSHVGRWDKWLYPDGIEDPRTGFLCMYAVPLFMPIAGSTRERVVGVLKMERRRMKGGKRRGKFTNADLESFDVIASIMGFAYFHSERQKSLTLADIGHVLLRPLGDVTSTLDLLLMSKRERPPQEVSDLDRSRQMLRALSHLLRLAKDSHHQPLELDSVNVIAELERQSAPISTTSGRFVKVKVPQPIADLVLNKRAHAALINIAVNLLHNATEAAPAGSEVTLTVVREPDGIALRVENPGAQVQGATLRDAQNNAEKQSFRGLPRSYQLAERNGWSLAYRYDGGLNVFELRLSPHRITG